MARSLSVLLALAAASFLSAALTSPVNGQAWLANGGFESGTSGWFISQGTLPVCEPFEGNEALGISASEAVFARVSREIAAPFEAAAYTLSGWLRVQSGSAEVSLNLGFIRPLGLGLDTETAALPSGPDYASFSFTASVGFEPEAVRIAFDIESTDGAEVCFDNLSLTTPDPAPTQTPPVPTPEETATIEPTVPAGQPTPTDTPFPTATPSSTVAPAATSTSGPSFVFTNGGFEQGLLGWSKNGGDLTTTANALSGGTAGLLISSTDSTKWAYQSVAIDASRHYELAAHLRPGDGIQQALLRISWYATSDAGGPAINTTDSLDVVSGASPGFVFLTTGSVAPPPGAMSARVRVLLVPANAGYATLSIDDAWFGLVAAPTPTPSPTSTAMPSSTPAPAATASPAAMASPTLPPLATASASATIEAAGIAETPAPDIASGAVAAPAPSRPAATTTEVVPASGPVAEAEGRRAEPPIPSTDTLESGRSVQTGRSPSSVPWAWILGGVLVVIGLGGAYLQHRASGR